MRPAELLETVPGVIITQHSGSGKANQYFARGFNLDHGTTIAGLRGDFYRADVESNLSLNSGSVEREIGSPKISLLFGPWRQTELYVNAAYGFHSNDARGTTITVDPTRRYFGPRPLLEDNSVRSRSSTLYDAPSPASPPTSTSNRSD